MTADKQAAFAANLRRLKEESGKTWPEIAADLGYRNVSTMQYFASGRCETRISTVKKIADYFGVPWMSMLEEEKKT